MISFVRSDHIGRPMFATNASGVKVWTAAYLPFGGVRVTTGTPPTVRFPGQWFQSETDLHQNWMRDYDPTTGRYMQADPLGLFDGASVYGYALGNPGRFTDPRGEDTAAQMMADAIVYARRCAIADGPSPIGDAYGAGHVAGVAIGLGILWAMSDGDSNADGPMSTAPTEGTTTGEGVCEENCEDDCAEQWREAYAICESILGQPRTTRTKTGGHTTIHGCAMGYVSERCHGNPVDWGPDGPPPGWSPG